MPELPDLAILSDAFHSALSGRRITGVSAPGPLAVRGTPAELAAYMKADYDKWGKVVRDASIRAE